MNRRLAIAILLAGGALLAGGEAPVTATLAPSSDDLLFHPGEAKALGVRLRNPGSSPRPVRLRLALRTDDGRQVEARLDLDAPAGDSRADLPVALAEPCFAEAQVTVAADGQADADLRTTLAVVRPPALARVPLEQAFYGVVFMDPRTAGRMGARFVRYILHWKFTHPEPGRVDLGTAPARGRRAAEHGVGILYSFTVHQLPPWLERAGGFAAPDWEARFQEWIAGAVAQVPPGERMVEISNEPDLELHGPGTAEPAALAGRLLRLGQAAARGVEPALPILGAGVSGVDFLNNLAFADAMLAAAPGTVDHVAAHPYADARFIDAGRYVEWPDSGRLVARLEAAVRLAARHTPGAAVWSSELGWAVPGAETGLSDNTRAFAAITAQAMVLFRTVAGVGKYSCHFGQLNGWLERGFHYGLFMRDAAGQQHPLPPVSAYATTASLLEGAGTGSRLALHPGAHAYRFANPATGRTVVALWSAAEALRLTVRLPAGVRLVDLYGRERDAAGAQALVLERAPAFLLADLAAGDALAAALAAGAWRADRPLAIAGLGSERDDRLTVRLTSLLPAAQAARIAVGDATVERRLEPGPQAVAVPVPGGRLPAGAIELPVRVEAGADATAAAVLRATVIDVPPCPAGVVADGRLSAAEAALAVHRLDTIAHVIPPDPSLGWGGPEDLSLRYGWAWDADGLYLVVVARDQRLQAAPVDAIRRFWEFDSLQFAVASALDAGHGYRPADREAGLFRDADGASHLVQTHPPRTPPLPFPAAVGREGGETVYEARLPWSWLRGPDARPAPGDLLAAGLVVNDNDGTGRRFWMGPSDGIGAGKVPAAFPWLRLVR